MKPWSSLLGAFALVLSTGANAQMWWQTTKPNNDFQEKPAAPLLDPASITLPPLPKEADLVEFQATTDLPTRFFVDVSSLNVGEDQVVRYTLVIKASGGAINTSYEGTHCNPLERMVYAFGQSDGTWYRPAAPRWAPIVRETARPHYRQLAKDILCDTGFPAGTAAEIVNALKKAAPRR